MLTEPDFANIAQTQNSIGWCTSRLGFWGRLIKIKPATANGAAALARYASKYSQITCDANGWEIKSLLTVLRHIGDMHA